MTLSFHEWKQKEIKRDSKMYTKEYYYKKYGQYMQRVGALLATIKERT